MSARPKHKMKGRTSRDYRNLIAWQGISVCVPDNWHIGAISGDEEEGYLRIQDDDMVRLETKWEQAKNFVDIEAVVEKYLNDLKRRSKRVRPAIKTRHGSRTTGPDELGRKSLVRFAWSGDRQGQGMAWLCGECNRVVIVQVIAPLDEDIRTLSRRVFSSFRDHPDGNWRTWATYGFVAEAPKDFKLADQKLMTGLIQFSFERDTEKLTVSRYALADVLLKNRSLFDWSREEFGKRLRNCACETDTGTLHGHEAILVYGSKSKLGPRVQRFVWHCLRRKYGDRMECIIWHCEESNKIFAVESTVDVATCGLAHEVAQRIRCH